MFKADEKISDMNQKKVQVKKTLGQQTEDRLMKYILDRQMMIGSKIPNEFELSEMFGVGRSTVREAVKGLVSRGVLEVRRGDGTYVISTVYMENDVLGFGQTTDRYQLALDLFDVRLMIEPEIVSWACRKANKEEIAHSLKAYLWYGGETYESRKLSFHILDRVGGGDAFVSGIIYGLMQDYKPEDIVNFGVASSAIKHTLHGDGNITDDVSLIRHVMEMDFDIKR